MSDFEDAVIVAAAQREAADYIITRNTKDFTTSPIPTVTQKDFLEKPLSSRFGLLKNRDATLHLPFIMLPFTLQDFLDYLDNQFLILICLWLVQPKRPNVGWSR